MTSIRVSLSVPTPTGDVGAVGHIRATPTRRRTVEDTIVLPAPFSSDLTDGVTTVEMAATSPDWCWKIDEFTEPTGGTRYVIVPESGLTLGYEDLVDVDPATLDPAAEPEAAWDVALEETDARTTYAVAQVESLLATHPVAGSQVIALNETDDVPLPALPFTIIARAVSVPPVPELQVVEGSKTTVRGSTGTNIVLDVPAGTVTNDLLVAVVSNAITGAEITPPPGWEIMQRLTTFADYRATYIFGYRVTGAAPGTPTFVSNSSGRYVASMFRVLGVDLTAPVGVNGTSGTRTTNTMHIPALLGCAGMLALCVANEQVTSPNQPIPAVLPVGFTKLLELGSTDDTGVTRTVLVIGWALPTADLPATDVVAASSVAAGAAQMLAIRGLP